jgi:hypothetical protein
VLLIVYSILAMEVSFLAMVTASFLEERREQSKMPKE